MALGLTKKTVEGKDLQKSLGLTFIFVKDTVTHVNSGDKSKVSVNWVPPEQFKGQVAYCLNFLIVAH